MTLVEMREKRTKLLKDAQDLLLPNEVTAEQRGSAAKILQDVEAIEADIAMREKVEAKLKEERDFGRPPRSVSGAEGEDAEKKSEERYLRAFSKYVRGGIHRLSDEERSALYEKRDVLTTNTGDAFLIPQQFNPTLIEAQKYIGGAVNLVNRKVTNNNGAPMRFSLANDTANVFTLMTEGTSLTDTDPSFTGFLSATDTVGTLVKASVQELDDSFFDLEAWIKKAFGVRYARGLDQVVVNGNGSNVASLATTATLGATAAAAAGPVYDDFTACYGAVNPSYLPNAKWLMNQATRAFLLGQKDNYGRPLWNVSPNNGTLDHILSLPVVITPNLPNAMNVSTTATATGVLLGDFEAGYTLRTDGPIHVIRLNERFMDALEVGFIAWSRIGGVSTDAGTHPVLSLVTPIA
jgi:HK97 family phage major capsid protein